MLPDDELDELATDIRAHGLLMPLLVGQVDGQIVLVDGRNRREGGKTPRNLELNGERVRQAHDTAKQANVSAAIVMVRLLETSKVTQQIASPSRNFI
jgi:hypothetical protein